MNPRALVLLKVFTSLLEQAEQGNSDVDHDTIAEGLERIRSGQGSQTTHHWVHPIHTTDFMHALFHGLPCECTSDFPSIRRVNIVQLLETSDLSERELISLFAYFGMNDLMGRKVPFNYIGQYFGVTKERVRQIIEKVLEKIRQHGQIPPPS